MAIEDDPIYERFQLIVNGPALFNAIVTGLDLDVFGYLRDHPGATFDDLLECTRLRGDKLRILMLALCTTGLVAKDGGKYTNSRVADECLAKQSVASWRDTLLGWRRFQYPAFPELTGSLRAGTNTALAAYPGDGPTLYHRLAADSEAEKAYHNSAAPFTHLYLTALLEHHELAAVTHLLDVGGGDGTTATQFALRHPTAKVTVFDMPTMTEHARQSIPDRVSSRIRFCGGDFFTDAFPSGVDGVLFSHVLEPFSADQIVPLMRKALEALPIAGKIFAYGTTAAEDEDGGPLAARLSLFLNVLASGTGMAHPIADYVRWLGDAGCTTVRSYPALPFEHGLAVGVKA